MKNKILISLLLSAPLAHAANLQEIKKADLLRVGVWEVSPPYGFVALDGDSYGFEVELAKQMAKDLLGDADKVDFVLISSADDRIKLLQDNKVDVVLANFTVTPERKKLVDFAKPYLKTQLGIISYKNAPVTDIKQLQGKHLLTLSETSADEYFSKHYPKIILDREAQDSELYRKFRSGKVKALVDDNTLLYPVVKESPALFVVGVDHIGSTDYIAPAVQKGNDSLLQFVNQEMDKFKKDGTFKNAWNKYLLPAYGKDIKPESILVMN